MSQLNDSAVVTENLVSRTSVPNGMLGVCPETREIVLGAGFGNEPYRLYVDRFRAVASVANIRQIANHEEGEYVVLIEDKMFGFYTWHKDTSEWEAPSEVKFGTDIPGDYGYWKYEGAFSIDASVQDYLKRPESFEANNLLILNEQGKVVDSGKKIEDLVLKSVFNNHAQSTSIHVTSEEKQAWNGKQNALSTNQIAVLNSGLTQEIVQKIAQFDPEAFHDFVSKFKIDGQDKTPVEGALSFDLSEKLVDHTPAYNSDVTQVEAVLVNRAVNKACKKSEDTEEVVSWKVFDGSDNEVTTLIRLEQPTDGNLAKWASEDGTWTLRCWSEYDSLYCQLVNSSGTYTKVGWDLLNEGEIDVSAEGVPGIATLRSVKTRRFREVSYSFSLPSAVSGYSRNFKLWVESGTVAVQVGSANLFVKSPLVLDFSSLGRGVYHFAEVGQNIFTVDELTGSVVPSAGTESNPLPCPFFLKKGPSIYKIDVIDDASGVDLDVERVISGV